jgi:DNA anti-recombination protein RmuC
MEQQQEAMEEQNRALESGIENLNEEMAKLGPAITQTVQASMNQLRGNLGEMMSHLFG